MAIIIIIIIELSILCLEYVLFREDIGSVSFITTFVIFVSTVCAALGNTRWGVIYTFKSVVVISTGLIIMLLADYSSTRLRIGRKYIRGSNTIHEICIPKTYNTILIIISVVLSALYTFEVYRIGMLYGASGINAFGVVKELYLKNPNFSGMNGIVRQFYKLSKVFAFIYVYIFVNNSLFRQKGNMKNLIPVIMGCITVIASGSRTDILHIASGGFIDYILLRDFVNNGRKKERKKSVSKLLSKILPVLLPAFLLAYISNSIVKTDNVLTSANSVVDYVLFYIGSPIAVLESRLTSLTMRDFLYGGDFNQPLIWIGKLRYGGNVATILQSVFSYGYLRMIPYIFFIFLLGGYCEHHFSKEPKFINGRSRRILYFSFYYHIFFMGYYADYFYYDTHQQSIWLTLLVFVITDNWIFKKNRSAQYITERIKL